MCKTGTCRKCQRNGLVESHHRIPFQGRQKDKDTIDLCPNCHTEYHEYLPSDKQSRTFYERFFLSWISGVFDKRYEA